MNEPSEDEIKAAQTATQPYRKLERPMQHDEHMRAWLRWWVFFDSVHTA